MIAEASWRALGTGERLVVRDGDPAAARAAVERVLAEVDLAYSRFRPDSELTALNARAGATMSLSPLLATAIAAALRAARVTRGAVDPTVGTSHPGSCGSSSPVMAAGRPAAPRRSRAG